MLRRFFCKAALIAAGVGALLSLTGVLQAQGRSDEALERVIAIQERNTERLLAMEDVEGTAVGLDENGELAIKVYTARPAVGGIPANLEGVPVRVVVTGRFFARADETARVRPAPIGFSTGHPDITAGTIGCRVTDGEYVYALSNNHVYANSNKASIGDPALQPGPYDGGTLDDAIGTLADFEPIIFSGANNIMDAAIAISTPEALDFKTPSDEGYGVPSPTVVEAFVGQSVQKYGRTTGLTKGNVSEINVTVDVCYEARGPFFCKTWARFVGQIAITPGAFSSGGDSGALIVTNDGTKNPVGLLFAGSTERTIANPIGAVLTRFGVSIDDGAAAPPASTGSISGEVTSSSDGPIDGATVTTDTGQSATTGSGGAYTLSNVPTGERTVTASAAGFQSQTTPASVTAGQTTIVDFSLNPVPTGGTVRVDSITYATSGGKNNDKHLSVTVALVDGLGAPVGGASVSVTLTHNTGKSWTASGTTGTGGTVTFTLSNAPSGTYTTKVTNVSAGGLAWDGNTPPNSFTK